MIICELFHSMSIIEKLLFFVQALFKTNHTYVLIGGKNITHRGILAL
jgi:hypothetical protein